MIGILDTVTQTATTMTDDNYVFSNNTFYTVEKMTRFQAFLDRGKINMNVLEAHFVTI
jgi:hypothetical protein